MADYSVQKYQLEFKKRQIIQIPVYAKILDVKTVEDTPFLFVLDENGGVKRNVEKCILMYDTDQPFEKYDIDYLNTVKDYRGILKHVFIEN